MMQFFLEPVDVWLFRDGKPFDAKSDHRARSLFPPYPSVMQGVIRSHHLVVKGIDLTDKQAIEATVGTAEKFGDFRMRGPFLARKDEKSGRITRYFPVPTDVAPREDGYRPLHPGRTPDGKDGVLTSVSKDDLPLLLWPGKEEKPTKKEFGQWLDEKTLLDCLNGQSVTGTSSSELFVRENRFGIGRNDATRTADEGALYEVDFIRPCGGVGLWVQVDGYSEWPTPGVLRIGGEGRAARFTNVAPPLMWPSVDDPLPARFKVYFANPTYFTGGWKPTNGWGEFFDGNVTLQAVALRGYESLGGYDWANNKHKPARRYVPAGSVYYFSHDGAARLKQDAITETESEAKIGFGQVIITEWKER